MSYISDKRTKLFFLAAGCGLLLPPLAARAGWLLWEAPPAPIAVPAGEKTAASVQAILPSLLPAESCGGKGRDCAKADTIFEGGETEVRAFLAANGLDEADYSLRNVFFSGLKGLYSGRPGSGPRLTPRREYRGRPQDLSFVSDYGRGVYVWRLPFRTAAGPLWLAAPRPGGCAFWDNALKTQKKARAVKARASSSEFLIITLPYRPRP